MSILKSWQWMESCFSSDREKDLSTQRSDCCINVSFTNINSLTVAFGFHHIDNKLTSLFIDPFILPHQQVDKGAIKFVLSGANIMCPGLTSPGAKLHPAEADTVVVSFCMWCWSIYLPRAPRANKNPRFTLYHVWLHRFVRNLHFYSLVFWMDSEGYTLSSYKALISLEVGWLL